jgi:hypothetical protein
MQLVRSGQKPQGIRFMKNCETPAELQAASIIWTSLTISLDGQPTANTIMLKMLDQIYTVSPLQ